MRGGWRSDDVDVRVGLNEVALEHRRLEHVGLTGFCRSALIDESGRKKF